jgi:integrase
MKNVEVVLPYLVLGDAKWFIEYRCFDPIKGLMQRYRIYKGLMNKPDAERLKYADDIIKYYTNKLKAGWRPWDKTKYIYIDEIEYSQVKAHWGESKNDFNHLRKNMSEFLLAKKQELASKSYESYNSKIRLFCQFLEHNGYGNIRPFEISNKIVIAFFEYLINERKLDKVTVGKYRQNLGMMFTYFKKKKVIEVIPMDDLPKEKKMKDNAARPMMDNDMVKFIEYVAKKDQQMFLASLFQFFLCCRPGSELRLMKIQDLDLSSQVVYIRFDTGKTGARRIVMPDALLEICNNFNLGSYPKGHYLFGKDGFPGLITVSKNHFTGRFAKYRDELGLSELYKFYSFKHTGAGKLLESGATIAEVKSHLGHTSVESTIAYIHRHFGERSQKVLDFMPDVMKGFMTTKQKQPSIMRATKKN